MVRGHAVRGAAPGRLAVGGAASVIGGQDAVDHGLDLVLGAVGALGAGGVLVLLSHGLLWAAAVGRPDVSSG
ncbi:hypothetical protein HMPREF0569_1378 [Micrococcus luteus SK58]|nr:hypothetical protein HMPREF0569_1378 [Micrococcus luteus SK58]